MTIQEAEAIILKDLKMRWCWILGLVRLEGQHIQGAGYKNEAEVLKAIRESVDGHSRLIDNTLEQVP